ncbi:ankyrin repeat domain-containing protein [Arenibacter latericius]|uniref:ankyrin repeat domain-containing protein n=1 Tax=Arenibacter latericius TaxID=86104 RepID=UPI0003FC02A6|nr:ankyrin repeat domain-containing protein [Arenibacter latericius]
MRKTIVIAAIAFLCMSAGFSANKPMDKHENFSVLLLETPRELSSFCKAIVEGDVATVKRFIDLGEDVNKKSLGKTPAIFAARYNKAEILSLLIKNGADLTVRCDNGYTAKRHAEFSNATDALAVINAHLRK